jgi:HSP20 family protein
MVITRIHPFHHFATTLEGRLGRIFDDAFLRDEDVRTHGDWIPPVDVFETDEHDLVIKAELPDMTRDDIEVTVDRNTLTLKGTKKATSETRKEQYRRVERTYGTFSRSFTLPETVDATKVTADYRNGVLTVKLPYREEAKPRAINVEVAA